MKKLFLMLLLAFPLLVSANNEVLGKLPSTGYICDELTALEEIYNLYVQGERDVSTELLLFYIDKGICAIYHESYLVKYNPQYDMSRIEFVNGPAKGHFSYAPTISTTRIGK